MSRSSRKGDLREAQWAALVGGKKVSRKGYKGPDVVSPPRFLVPPLSTWEVKSKEDLPLWLVGDDGWLSQMAREGADAVVFRQNRGPWYLIVDLGSGAQKLNPHRVNVHRTLDAFSSEDLLGELARRLEARQAAPE